MEGYDISEVQTGPGKPSLVTQDCLHRSLLYRESTKCHKDRRHTNEHKGCYSDTRKGHYLFKNDFVTLIIKNALITQRDAT